MNSPNPIQNLLIAGRGFTPVLTALFLQKRWGSLAPRITLLQCGKNNDPPIISCVSSIKEVHRELGISEKDFVRSTQASFHLGTLCQFPDQTDFFLSEASYGFSIQSVRFHHWFVRFLQSGNTGSFDDFCINAQLAKRGRFAPPSTKAESVYSQVCFGYKLLSEAYAQYLMGLLDPRTSVIHEEIDEVEVSAAGIKSIRLKSRSTVTADLYIDCTPDHTLKRFISSECRPTSSTTSWSIGDMPQPSLGPAHNLLSVRGQAITLTTELHGKRYDQEISWAFGQSPEWLSDPTPWVKNCLSLGPAASDRPALLVDPIHLVASSLYTLYRSWPVNQDLSTPADTYNSSFRDEWERITDSDSLYIWAANGRDDKCLTEATKRRLKVFASDGRIPPFENETLMEDQWAALFFALGIRPKVADPLTEGVDESWITQQMQKLKHTIAAAAENAPSLAEFYQREVLKSAT